ncbi:MAG: RHS repeat-associated core domain-containing protein [Pirellulales bacterium]|nr:RHS repeat-associated core domain-containing protein [Pirellulales bacterium]
MTNLGGSGLVDGSIRRISTAYDDLGRVEFVTSHSDPDPGEGDVVNQVKYVYNGWGRLAQEYQAHDGAVGGGTPSVEYDYTDGAAAGVAKYVRLAQVTVNEANEIDGITGGWVTPEYDDAGNMIYAPMPGDGTNHYHLRYDAWNRLVEVIEPGEYWSASQIEYDGLNRRIAKVGDIDQGEAFETREYYYNDRWQVVEEWALNSDEVLIPNSQYVWSPRYIDALILRDRDTDEDYEFDERLYALSDANYNVTALVDEDGDVIERYVYDAYGAVTVLEPNFAADADNRSDVHNTTLYTGRSLDGESGLMYYRNRYYHTGLGGFVTRDPISYRGGFNLYEYVANSPVDYIDPLGLTPIAWTKVGGPYRTHTILATEMRWVPISVGYSLAWPCKCIETTVSVLEQRRNIQTDWWQKWARRNQTLVALQNQQSALQAQATAHSKAAAELALVAASCQALATGFSAAAAICVLTTSPLNPVCYALWSQFWVFQANAVAAATASAAHWVASVYYQQQADAIAKQIMAGDWPDEEKVTHLLSSTAWSPWTPTGAFKIAKKQVPLWMCLGFDQAGQPEH